MKLKFNADLEYQKEAISSVVDLFLGQTPKQSNFTVSHMIGQIGLMDTQNGVGNKLELDEVDILDNLQAVQLRNGLKQTTALKKSVYDFDVEMETGTGKTYVYLRAIFELNKNFGFTKFIIVVPSIAIKEGVYKSLQITSEHFKGLYDNVTCDYFIYDSSKLDQVRNFAVSDHIQIMIINIDAFRKSFTDPDNENKANIIHRVNDRLSGMKPIELIRETHPFVIVDEPQSVDNTPKSKEAIASLNPLCTLRYSATHVEKHNLVYKLDAVDAYTMGLVKQIEVAGFESADYHNKAYIRLLSVNNAKSPITARVEIDIQKHGKTERSLITVLQGTDLYEKSGGREVYEGYIVNDIYCEKRKEYIDFTSKPDTIPLGKAIGEIDDVAIKEQQIRKTIEEHLDKELILNEKGIKVLSLFFIDRVANYRLYDENSVAQKGIYATLFEKAYQEIVKKPKYNQLFVGIDQSTAVEQVHKGYFAIDRKAKRTASSEDVFKDTTSGASQDDDDAYNTIMRAKEFLLSFESKLRFIFSHSALREGWDNPNVFQICTLNETQSTVKKRQEIGRGLRLCVNQQGERLNGSDINILTVMANESYQEFAEGLQKEIEDESGIRFGVIEAHTFADLTVKEPDGSFEYLGQVASEKIHTFYRNKGYIDERDKVTDKLKQDLKNNRCEIPPEFAHIKEQIIALTKKVSGKLNIKNNDDKRKVELNKQVYLSEEFKALWNTIKYKTTYAVVFNSETLIQKCCKAIQSDLTVESAKLIYTKASVTIAAGGVDATETKRNAGIVAIVNETPPDIITFLQNKTTLTRRTIVEILTRSKTLHLFKKNPQKYMDEVGKIIESNLRLMIVDGIKYTKIGEDEFYAQQLFADKELYGYLSNNMLESKKSVYEYVVNDSDNESSFASRFENNENVKLYARLPDWFKIQTPIGSYNPDWAVLMEMDGAQKLYFVLETKTNLMAEALRPNEHAKIQCGKAHFKALGTGVEFKPVDSFDHFIEGLG